MKPTEIAENLARLETMMAAKGYYAPKVTTRQNWFGSQLTIDLEYRSSAHEAGKTKFIHTSYDDGFEHMFDLAEKFIDGMKSIQDAKRDAFIAAVGRLIDQGRDIGVEIDFLNPLTEMMEKLSTNIITHQP